MSNEVKQTAVENISDYLMISAKDAEEFYEWVIEETNWAIYVSIERWIHLKTRKLVNILHVYELYKQYQETKNLSLLKPSTI